MSLYMKKVFSLYFLFVLSLLGCMNSGSNAETQIEKQGVKKVSLGNCPQVRKTSEAPKAMLKAINPLNANPENFQKGKKLYQKTATPLVCKTCHGENGSGLGDPDFESTPAARNFTCNETMQNISDGQLFWIIKNGSPNTSMPSHADLSDEDIWSLVLYLRSFSNSK